MISDLFARLWRRSPAAPAVEAAAQPAFPPLSPADRDALVRTVWGEARGEPEAGKIAVVHVIRNRVLKAKTSASVECHRPWQFSCWNANDPNLQRIIAMRESDPAYASLALLVDEAWQAPDTVQGARHYYNPAIVAPSWAKPPARQVAKIGGHVFWAGVA